MLKAPAINGQMRELIQRAVREDIGTGDATVKAAIPKALKAAGRIVAREPGVVSGAFLLKSILTEYGRVTLKLNKEDGDSVKPGDALAELSGGAGIILSAERVLLNFLGRMSGVATLTRRYVEEVAGTKAVICDTRKTIPGWRLLDKYAVRCGGGVNDRIGLYDGVMLKDNHLVALRKRLGSGLTLAELTRHVRAELPKKILLWLEVDTLQQLRDELHGGGADIVLLDNFSIAQMKPAVTLRNNVGKLPLLEASGGITLANLRQVAHTGVDRISIGALTHSAKVLDLSMEFA